jgi:general secretion pathway protein D
MSANKSVMKKRRSWIAFGCLSFLALLIILLVCAEARAQVSGAQQDEPVLKAYSCAPGKIESAVDGLRARFQALPNVRITADNRSAQLLVYAPPGVQAQIAESLAAPNDSEAARSAARSPANTSTGAAGGAMLKTVDVSLQNISARQLEETLVRSIGKRLAEAASQELGTKCYNLILPNGGIVRFDIFGQLNRSRISGSPATVDAFARLIRALDAPARTADESLQLVSLNSSRLPATRRAVEAIQTSDMDTIPRNPVVTKLFQNPKEEAKPKQAQTLLAQAQGMPQEEEEETTEVTQVPGQLATERGVGEIGQIGPVQVEMLEGLDVLIIRGHKKDVEQVMNVIKQVEQLSAKTEPAIEVYKLKYIDGLSVADLIRPVYDEVYLMRQGSVSITALVKPNALLIVGRKENVKTMIDLVRRLDQPVAPETQFKVFHLRHAASTTAAATLTEFYANRTGLGAKVFVSDDSRSNSIIVQASPRDMTEVADLISRIDTPTSEAVNELRVVPLRYTMASDLAAIIMDAISGQAPTARVQAGLPGAAVPGAQAARPAGAAAGTTAQRSAVLRFLTIDAEGKRLLQSVKSGILSDVKVSADVQANALVISAPAESMDLLAALVHELDTPPKLEAQIKVFTIVNGDATTLATMLQSLFGAARTQAAAGFGAFGALGQQGMQAIALEGEASLVPIRLAVDTRTNSIIASGSKNDLIVIEAILLRLESADVRNRESHVYRLKNAPAASVSTAINQFLLNVRQLQQATPGFVSAFEQIEQEVIVVPETVSNSLIVSATPRFFKDIQEIIMKLDEQPPMVLIQVLIGQLTLNDTDQFGVELGLQDGLLFDRSAAGTSSVTSASTLFPGYAFNNQTLGNSATGPAGTSTLNQAPLVGTQGLSNFSLNRVDPTLGFGGFVFSASSESVSVLIRALKENRRLEVLSRPQVMTLDNQPAYIQVGQQVPTITGTSATAGVQNFSLNYQSVGLIVNVTPRISPEGLVSMQIDAIRSFLGPISEGVPVSVVNGQTINSPIINITQAQTTVSAMDGQTVILGGLITKNKTDFHRKVPWIGDVPVLGRLFRYDGVTDQRDELLIIMTPHVIRPGKDGIARADELKKIEAARMNWCLSDVIALTDDYSLRPRSGDWPDKEMEVIYPDLNPRAEKPVPGEAIPVPPAELKSDRKAAPNATGAPPEPPRIPEPDAGVMLPKQPSAPANSQARFSIGSQVPQKGPVMQPAVQAATFQGPVAQGPGAQGPVVQGPGAQGPVGFSPQGAAPAVYAPNPNAPGGVAPAVYEAPPQYPATQQP